MWFLCSQIIQKNQIDVLTVPTHNTALPDGWTATPLITRPPQRLSALLYNHRSYCTKVSVMGGLCDSCYKVLITVGGGRCNCLKADSHIPCRSPATTLPLPCHGLERSLSESHIHGMAGERHGNGMVCVNQTRPHCVNQMGKTQFKPQQNGMAGERQGPAGNGRERQGNGRATTWYVWIGLYSFTLLHSVSVSSIRLQVVLSTTTSHTGRIIRTRPQYRY
jgi:hypothetical protein